MSRAVVTAQHPQQQVSRRRSKAAGASVSPVLPAFQTVYNVLRCRHLALGAYLDDRLVPAEQRKAKIGEFQRLAGCLNLLIEEIKGLGYSMSPEEIRNGFDGQEK